MKRVRGNLQIGFNGAGHASHTKYPIDNGKPVPVDVQSDCWVWFTKHKEVFFDNSPVSGNHHYDWMPKRDDVTAEYRVGDHQGHPPRRTLENTYSIKVGSGIERKRKRKSRRRPKAKTSGKTAQKTAKKRTKSSLRRRK